MNVVKQIRVDLAVWCVRFDQIVQLADEHGLELLALSKLCVGDDFQKHTSQRLVTPHLDDLKCVFSLGWWFHRAWAVIST